MAIARYSFVSLICAVMLVSTCAAQNRGSRNQGGALGQGAGSQSAFGGTGQSAFGAGTGGRGQSGVGAGFGSNAFGAQGGGAGFGGNAGGQGFGNNQLGIAQGTFLGGDAAQTQNFFRNLNGGQRRTAMFDFMIENLNEMRDRGNGGTGNDRSPPVRVKLRPAFETPLGTMAQVTSDVHARLATSLAEQGVADSRVSLDGRTITLEGRIATEHQKQLIEKMISLEPGVSMIDNRLVVDPTVADQE